MNIDQQRHPNAAALLNRIVARWPEHEPYLEKSVAERAPEVMAVSDRIAEIAIQLSKDVDGGIDTLIDDYRYMCDELMLPEELYFRRHGKYRLSSFEDANREVYANAALMKRYVNGILISHVAWANHANALGSFVNDYLPRVKEGADHLEIGPGHGIILYFAAIDSKVGSVSGWDVSETSIAHTRHALEALGITRPVDLTLQDVTQVGEADEGGRFDSIVMSEILEHLEDPFEVLKAAAKWLRPGGLFWINVPANSPAPDHIFLYDNIEHAEEMVRHAGLEVVDSKQFPMTGTTLEKAIKRKMTVTCVITARKPG